jgi:SAM-dependent methyltransferase
MIIKDFNERDQTVDFGNSELFRHYTTCPICHSPDIKYSITSRDNHYGVDGEYHHFRCASCTALFLNPMPTERFLSNAYPSNYFAYRKLKGRVLIRDVIKKIFFVDNDTKDPQFNRPGKILDVGCGNGEFLFHMSKNGWTSYGVEPSQAAASVGERHGLTIHNGTLLSANYPENFFDYVRSNHSLEHMPNPHDNLKEIARILKPGGKLFIGVPNTDGFALGYFKEYWWNLTAPQHPINYNERSLKALVLPYGFKAVSMRTHSPYAGLLGSYQIKVNNRKGKGGDHGMILSFFPFQVITGFISRMLDLFKRGDCLEMVFEKDIQKS